MSVRGNLFHGPDLARIRKRLASLTPDAERRWGRMSPHQAICHQADALEMALGRRPSTPRKPSMPLPLLKFVALRLPVAWPQGVPTVKEADQEIDGTQPGDFDEDRDRVDQLLQEFAQAPDNTKQLVHPIFGRLSVADWGRWAYRHSDHHLRQFGV